MKSMLLLLVACTLCACGNGNQPEHNQSQEQTEVIVYEYCPAMGQFVNLLPQYEEGDTYETICLKAQTLLRQDGLISLGGFGGYVTVGFGQPISNRKGYDFRIKGNAFYLNGSTAYGNSEPGTVWVSVDTNCDGLPNDPWYELAGSEYSNPNTIHNYEKTWYKSDTTLLNPFHTQPYFPQWLTDTVIHVRGTLLPSHKTEVGGVIVQQVLEYGYVDNKPNTDLDGISFDISWAVDENGHSVKLSGCDFIRVMTAVDEVYPQIGELSTELASIEILY